MNQDAEHLRLLSIFHYVVGGLAFLFSLFPLLYTAMGVVFVLAARHGKFKPDDGPPPEIFGWFFAAVGTFFFVMALTVAICVLISGRRLAKRTHYWFVFVIACVDCLFMPFGTILGIFTIIVLSRESVKQLFGGGTGSPAQ